jgi:hypothetical protein
MDLELTGEVWCGCGPALHRFLSVPEVLCGGIEDASSLVSHGRGMVTVTPTIGG